MVRIRRTSISFLLLLAVLLPACAGAGASPGSRADRSGRNSDLLTAEEISEAQLGNLYDVVERLRPRWLQVRNLSSLNSGSSQIVVFLNTKYVGGPEALREFQPNSVLEVRYLDGPRASATLQGYPDGQYVAGGIVLVTNATGRQ